MRREKYPGVRFVTQPLFTEVGARIRRCRLEDGLSVRALARLSRLTPRRITRIEAGLQVNGFFEPYLRLAKELGIRPYDLFDDTDRLN